jgi:molybdopterin-guanine dinucleotide biosynthesis protein A
MDKISGIILSGGKSSRMGEDKAFLPFPDKPLIEIVIDKLKLIFKELLIITDKPEHYKKYNVKIFKDEFSERGPLGGIYTGLIHSQNKYNFVIACDMPFLNLELINYLIQKINNYDLVSFKYKGKIEPLFAIYSKNCISAIEKQLQDKDFKITNFFSKVKVKIIEEKEALKYDPQGLSFISINTSDEYQKYKNFHLKINLIEAKPQSG